MAKVARGTNSPYVDGETLLGADLEEDFNNLVAGINNINDSQVVSGADISGSKLAATSVTNGKISDNTLTTLKMDTSSWPRGYTASSSATSALDESTDYVDADIGALSLANMTSGDLVFVEFCGIPLVDSADHVFEMGLKIDSGSDIEVAQQECTKSTEPQMMNWIYSFTASSTTHTLTARIKNTEAAPGSWSASVRTFRAQVFPQKA